MEIWTRNAVDVEAVQVTEFNMERVADWTHGEVCRTKSDDPRWYVLVDTTRGGHRTHRSKMFAGDWVVFTGGQFRHYRNDSIKMVYHKKVDPREEIQRLLQESYARDIHPFVESTKFIDKIMDILEGRGGV